MSQNSFMHLRAIRLSPKQEKIEVDEPNIESFLDIAMDELDEIIMDDKTKIAILEQTTFDESEPVLSVQQKHVEEENSCVQIQKEKQIRKGKQCTVCGKVVKRLDS
jgi:hypothetical protein